MKNILTIVIFISIIILNISVSYGYVNEGTFEHYRENGTLLILFVALVSLAVYLLGIAIAVIGRKAEKKFKSGNMPNKVKRNKKPKQQKVKVDRSPNMNHQPRPNRFDNPIDRPHNRYPHE